MFMPSLVTYTSLRLFLDGMLSMMALFALLSYFQQRKAIYWQYAFYIVCMIVTFRIDDADYARASYLPGADYWAALIEATAFVLYIRFAILLINIPKHDPGSFRLLRLMVLTLAGGAILDTILLLAGVSDGVRSQFYILNRFTVAAGALVVIPRILRLRQPVVSYFIAGTLLFTAGCLLALVINFIPQIFTRNPANPFSFPISYMQIGVVGEVLCFTLGMSLRNREMEREKIQYQEQLIEQLRENEQKQRKLSHIRDDIARDLHDDIGSDLGSISLLSQVAAGQISRQPDAARETLRLIGQTAHQVVATMREIVWSLHSAQTSLESFGYRLQETAESLFEHQPTRLHLSLPVDDLAWILPAEGRRDLFLIIKEILHNVIRHARASNVYVEMAVETSTLRLTIRDDGVGFVVQDEHRPMGNGLRSIHQRATSLGGQLTVESRPGAGTVVSFRCPLTVDESVLVN